MGEANRRSGWEHRRANRPLEMRRAAYDALSPAFRARIDSHGADLKVELDPSRDVTILRLSTIGYGTQVFTNAMLDAIDHNHDPAARAGLVGVETRYVARELADLLRTIADELDGGREE